MQTGQSTSFPTATPTSTQTALLSPANVLPVLKTLYSTSLYVLTSLLSIVQFLAISIPKLATLPFIHGTRLTFSSVKLAMRPILPLLAPVFFASKIILIVFLGPLVALYTFIGVMYPAYVFLGAAVVIGAVVGFGVRLTSWAVLEGVLGIHLVGKDDEEFRPKRRAREKKAQVKQEVRTGPASKRRKIY